STSEEETPSDTGRCATVFVESMAMQYQRLLNQIGQSSFTLDRAACLQQQLRQTLWSDDQMGVLLLAVSAAVGQAGPVLTLGGRRALQDYGAFGHYISEKMWQVLEGDQMTSASKMETLLWHSIELGLRCPSEPTPAHITCLYLLTVEGSTKTMRMSPVLRHETFKAVKACFQKMKTKYDYKFNHVIILPMDPAEFQREHPTLFAHAFGDAKPATCKYTCQDMAKVVNAIPMRSNASSSKSCMQLDLSDGLGQGQGQGNPAQLQFAMAVLQRALSWPSPRTAAAAHTDGELPTQFNHPHAQALPAAPAMQQLHSMVPFAGYAAYCPIGDECSKKGTCMGVFSAEAEARAKINWRLTASSLHLKPAEDAAELTASAEVPSWMDPEPEGNWVPEPEGKGKGNKGDGKGQNSRSGPYTPPVRGGSTASGLRQDAVAAATTAGRMARAAALAFEEEAHVLQDQLIELRDQVLPSMKKRILPPVPPWPVLASGDDMPKSEGLCSPALLRRLALAELEPFEVVLNYWGAVRTLRDLARVDENDRGVMNMKARKLWEFLGIFPCHLNGALKQFWNLEGLPAGAQPGSSSGQLAAGPAGAQPGSSSGQLAAQPGSSSIAMRRLEEAERTRTLADGAYGRADACQPPPVRIMPLRKVVAKVPALPAWALPKQKEQLTEEKHNEQLTEEKQNEQLTEEKQLSRSPLALPEKQHEQVAEEKQNEQLAAEKQNEQLESEQPPEEKQNEQLTEEEQKEQLTDEKQNEQLAETQQDEQLPEEKQDEQLQQAEDEQDEQFAQQAEDKLVLHAGETPLCGKLLGGLPEELMELSSADMVAFWRATHSAVKGTELKMLTASRVAEKRTEESTRLVSGDYLPLSVWTLPGFDAELIKQSGNCVEHPVLGPTYCVALETNLYKVQTERSAILEKWSKKEKEKKGATAFIQDLPNFVLETAREHERSLNTIKEQEFKQSGEAADLPYTLDAVNKITLASAKASNSMKDHAGFCKELQEVELHASEWPVELHVSEWPVELHASGWPVEQFCFEWPVELHASEWPVEQVCSEWPVELHSSEWPLAPWNMIVYHDEVTVGNVLRFNNNRKYTAFYFSFRELGLGLRSEFNWLAFAVMRNTTVHKIENGMSNVVRHILRELFLPAHGFMHGVTLNLGTPVLFFATISNVLGDEAALKTTWSSKGAAGLKPCMLCKNVVSRSSGLADSSDFLQDITCPAHALFGCASATDIWALADTLAEQKLVLSKKDFANLEMATGLSHPTSLLGSITALDASSFLDARRKKLGLGYDAINYFCEANWKAPKHSGHRVKGLIASQSDSDSFKGDASQVLAVYPLIQCLAETIIAPQQTLAAETSSFLAMCKIVELLSCMKLRCPVPADLCDQLAAAQSQHLKLFVQSYGAEAGRPKHHFSLRLPSQIKRDKLILDVWVHERKHRLIKSSARAVSRAPDHEKCVMSLVAETQLDELGKWSNNACLSGPSSTQPDLAVLFNSGQAACADNLALPWGKIAVGDVLVSPDSAMVVQACLQLDSFSRLIVSPFTLRSRTGRLRVWVVHETNNVLIDTAAVQQLQFACYWHTDTAGNLCTL
ncbi:unnamed protein product, partial [Polarella glacialis]